MRTRTLQKSCLKFIDNLTSQERLNLLLNLLESCIEQETVFWRQEDVDLDPGIFWEATGEPLTERQHSPKEPTIEDGFGNVWSARCCYCGQNTMEVVRPGKVQCGACDENPDRLQP